MSNKYDTFMFYAGTYPDVESAEQGYQNVKDLYYGADQIDTEDLEKESREAQDEASSRNLT